MSAPFLLIEDVSLVPQPDTEQKQVSRTGWRGGQATIEESDGGDIHIGGPPLIIYARKFNLNTRSLVPQYSIFDSAFRAGELPYVDWNYSNAVGTSKSMHISTQPFLLRRYARCVAELWESKYGRRPMVHALTQLSLNGRPLQATVDPEVDLASVPIRWFGHNPWILDLDKKRIPHDAALPGFLGK